MLYVLRGNEEVLRRLKSTMKLEPLDIKTLKSIRKIVADTHGEETKESHEENKFSNLVNIPQTMDELDFLLRMFDMAINKDKEHKILFNTFGNRIEDTRDRQKLEQTIENIQSDYVYSVIDRMA